MKTISVLGSTGTVGVATLDVVRANPGLYRVCVLSAQRNVALLAEQAREMRAEHAVIGDESLLGDLQDALAGTDVKVSGGRSALIDAASIPADCTMAAIVGMAGLEPLLAAISNGKSVAIANKEPLVSAGTLVMDAARRHGTALLPVDSEHNAVFQVFDPTQKAAIERIILTASGGPFREWTKEQMEEATPAQAVTHPNWTMGAKISVDSATMMNKALEVIEAHYLFAMPPEKIDVLMHPQSIIHAMVEYADGSVLAHMGAPDMRVPITHALGWPDRIGGPAQRLDFTRYSNFSFEAVDPCRFPAINYAYSCMEAGQDACIAFNAANEIAVAAFLEGRIKFTDIFDIVRRTVEGREAETPDDLASILALDSRMRSAALACIVGESTQPLIHTDRKVS